MGEFNVYPYERIMSPDRAAGLEPQVECASFLPKTVRCRYRFLALAGPFK